jgi:hypothetical protein
MKYNYFSRIISGRCGKVFPGLRSPRALIPGSSSGVASCSHRVPETDGQADKIIPPHPGKRIRRRGEGLTPSPGPLPHKGGERELQTKPENAVVMPFIIIEKINEFFSGPQENVLINEHQVK